MKTITFELENMQDFIQFINNFYYTNTKLNTDILELKAKVFYQAFIYKDENNDNYDLNYIMYNFNDLMILDLEQFKDYYLEHLQNDIKENNLKVFNVDNIINFLDKQAEEFLGAHLYNNKYYFIFNFYAN